MADEKRVKKFLKNHPHFELFRDTQGREKVKCKLTRHELPCRLSDLENYTKGKKYQRLIKEVPSQSPGYEDYKEFLKPSEKQRHQLFCELTKRHINNAPHHIQRHVTGKRFTRALEKYREQQRLEAENTEDEEAMWVPSDLESDSEEEEGEAKDKTMDDDDDSGGEFSSDDEDESFESKDGLKRKSQEPNKNTPNKKIKASLETELQKEKISAWPRKPKAKRSKAS